MITKKSGNRNIDQLVKSIEHQLLDSTKSLTKDAEIAQKSLKLRSEESNSSKLHLKLEYFLQMVNNASQRTCSR